MMRRIDRAGAGFTLIEVAVALFLLALLFGSVFIPLREQLDTRKTAVTARLLAEAREALLGYAISRGYFPCPANETSAGQEPPGTDHASGACPTYYGFLPAAALGIQNSDWQGYAVDGWAGASNRIRYAVSDVSAGTGTNTHAFTRSNGLRTAGIAALSDPALSLFHVCATSRGVVRGRHCGSAPTIVSTAPAMVWSSGQNSATGGASADEAQNPNPQGGSADRIFVTHVRTHTDRNEFDDMLMWVPMPRLISALVAAGHLP